MRHTRDLEKAATAAGVAVSTDIVSGYDHMGVYFALMEPHSAISERVAKFIAAHSRS